MILNQKDQDILRSTLKSLESSGDYSVIGGAGGSYIGAYQLGTLALIDLGYLKEGVKGSKAWKTDSNWTGKDGIHSYEDFLKNEAIQDQAVLKYASINEGYLKNKGVQVSSMTPEELGGILAVAHLLGAGGARNYLKGIDGADAFGTKASKYYETVSEKIKKADKNTEVGADVESPVPGKPEPEDVEKDIVFTAPNAPVTQIAQPCPEKTEDAPVVTENEECRFDALTIMAAGRNFVYDWEPGVDSSQAPGVYEIIAGPKKNTCQVDLIVQGLVVNCGSHAQQHWDLADPPFTGAQKTFQLTSKALGGIKERLWPAKVNPRTLFVKPFTCSQSHQVKIRVFPDQHWKFKLSFGYDDGMKYGISAEVKTDGQTYSLAGDPSALPELKKLKEKEEFLKKAVNNLIEGGTDDLIGFLKKNKKVEAELNPTTSFSWKTNFDLEAEWGWFERKGSPYCDYKLKLGLNANPLIEVEYAVDLAGPVLKLIPGVGPALSTVVKLLELTNAFKLDLNISIGGAIGANFPFTEWLVASNAPEDPIDEGTYSINVNGQVVFKLELVCKVPFWVGFLKFGFSRASAEFKAGGSGGIGVNPDSSISVGAASTKVVVYFDLLEGAIYASGAIGADFKTETANEVPNRAKDYNKGKLGGEGEFAGAAVSGSAQAGKDGLKLEGKVKHVVWPGRQKHWNFNHIFH